MMPRKLCPASAARKVAGAMLADIERRGEAAVREYAEKLDQWTGDIVVTPDEVERRTEGIAGSIKRDIEFATQQVRRFADAQRESLREFSIEPREPLARGFGHVLERIGAIGFGGMRMQDAVQVIV